MKNKKMRLAILSTITILSGCAFDLPPDAPPPPVIEPCTLIVFKNEQAEIVRAFWRCENTATREKSEYPIEHVQIGLSGRDWNATQAYRRELVEWGKDRSQCD